MIYVTHLHLTRLKKFSKQKTDRLTDTEDRAH